MWRIFLIGYMGSGKTTIGKLLAKRAGLQFVDLDLFIENRYHKSIEQLFSEKGESGFREIERRALEEVAGFEDIVISTGGGAPCFFDNMTLMNQRGLTVYLKVSESGLAERLNYMKHNRPLIKDKNEDELKIFISESLGKRELFYNQAKLRLDAEQLLDEEDVDNIVISLIETMKVMHI
ncbi:MAG: shikimate kinase [Dysgonamonadaceae bacterium]|nr:shikimate kinase [Dysgonamonadaceae bacterium]